MAHIFSSKRSQAEILGLAIIVAIIIIGILLSLRFLNKDTVEESKDDFIDSTLASNMLNVILRTDLQCNNLELKSLFQDCAEGLSDKEYCSGLGTEPCAIVKEIVSKNILDKTLKVWKKNYTFIASYKGVDKITIPDAPTCTPANVPRKFKSILQQSYTLPIRKGGIMEIELSICK